jgi:cytochrome c
VKSYISLTKIFIIIIRERQMNHHARNKILASVIAGAFSLIFSLSAFADNASTVKVDAVAAKKLARADHCLRCHAVNRKKEGPSFQTIAYKYKGQADASDKLVKHITSGEDRVKLSDGHEETHKFDTTTDKDKINNLVNWILAQ